MNPNEGRHATNWKASRRPVATPSINFLSACELKVKPISWLVNDYLEQDTLAVMYGPPAGGKSFIALDVSCCIASATAFHGHEVQPGAVFYIAGEGHNGIARRLKAWATLRGTSTPPLLFVSDAPADLADAGNAAKVGDAIELLADATGKQPTLIVIDTMARNFSGDENSATEVGNFVRNADAIRRRWAATVLIVHHSGKNSENGARGSSALRGAADAEYEVSRNSEDKVIRLASRKMKDAEEPEPLAFQLTGVPIYDELGTPIGGAALQLEEYTAPPVQAIAKLGKHQKAALVTLELMHTAAVEQLASEAEKDSPIKIHMDSWKSECEKANIPRQRFHEAKKVLSEKGHIRLEDSHVVLVRPVQSPLGRSERTDKLTSSDSGRTTYRTVEEQAKTAQCQETCKFCEVNPVTGEIQLLLLPGASLG